MDGREPRLIPPGFLHEVWKPLSIWKASTSPMLESDLLRKQAANNTKEQFANSPDLNKALLDAIMDALEAHTIMSTQALESETVRAGLKSILLGPAQLYEALRH